jgi:hypothetical protein
MTVILCWSTKLAVFFIQQCTVLFTSKASVVLVQYKSNSLWKSDVLGLYYGMPSSLTTSFLIDENYMTITLKDANLWWSKFKGRSIISGLIDPSFSELSHWTGIYYMDEDNTLHDPHQKCCYLYMVEALKITLW